MTVSSASCARCEELGWRVAKLAAAAACGSLRREELEQRGYRNKSGAVPALFRTVWPGMVRDANGRKESEMLQSEERLALTEAAKQVPGRPNPSTIWRWCRR